MPNDVIKQVWSKNSPRFEKKPAGNPNVFMPSFSYNVISIKLAFGTLDKEKKAQYSVDEKVVLL